MPRRLDEQQFAEFREEANRFAELHKENSRLAKRSYRNGNKSRARHYSNEAKRLRKLMDEANHVAAEKIFKHVNIFRPDGEIDLHGLYVKEATEVLKMKLAEAQGDGLQGLDVIVGQGNHSEGGPRIKPAVIAYAKTNKLTYNISDRNPGCIHFDLAPAPKPLLVSQGPAFNPPRAIYNPPKPTYHPAEPTYHPTTAERYPPRPAYYPPHTQVVPVHQYRNVAPYRPQVEHTSISIPTYHENQERNETSFVRSLCYSLVGLAAFAGLIWLTAGGWG